jgi:signal recognition particle GTPase
MKQFLDMQKMMKSMAGGRMKRMMQAFKGGMPPGFPGQ